MEKRYSFFDNRGVLYIDCTECTRGFFGDDKDECSAGFRHKKPKKSGCFIGTIKKGIDLEKLEKLK